MAINTNTPSLGYVQWKDLLITCDDIIYQIKNSYTCKHFIYWDKNNPYELVTSNVTLDEKQGLYYIYFNQNGMITEVPQDEITLSFSDGESVDLIAQKIVAFGEQQSINNEKFTTLEMDIDGIKTSVGEVKEDINGTKQTISEIDQKADSISLNVSTLEREYANDEELRKLRDNTNMSLLKLQSSLGLFNSDMNTYMEDNKLSDEERNNIKSYKEIITESKEELNKQINEVIKFLTSNGKTTESKTLTTQQTSLNDAFSNLFANIDTAINDNVFTNTEMTTITTYFSKANTKINETNNMIDEFIFLGSSGKIVEKLSGLTIKQDEIKAEVKEEITKVETNTNDEINSAKTELSEKITTIEKRVSSAEQKITKDAITDTVKDTFYTKTEVDGKINVAIKNVDVLYYLSTSSKTLTGGTWQTTSPTWQDGRYIWSKTIYTYSDGGTIETNPVCITGVGAKGTGITSITEEYYLSTSKTELIGGTWKSTPPTWTKGTYMWTRSKIVYSNPTSTQYTTPICGSEWEVVNNLDTKVENTKTTVAQHTTSLGNISGRVSTTESNITTINGEIVNVTKRVSTAEQKITDDAITDVISKTFYTKTETDEHITEQLSEVKRTVSEWSATIKENGEEISKLKLTDEEFTVEIRDKADSSNIISKINASTEGITIKSNKIDVSGLVTFSDLSTNGKTTINGSNIKTGTIDASKATIINLNASNITAGTLSGSLIQGGTIKGVTLQTYADSTSKGVVINKESMYLNGTKFLYKTSDNFRIASDQTLTLSSPKDIYLMPGLSANESQTGTNTVVIPNSTLRTQKLTVISDTNMQGTASIGGKLTCGAISSNNSISATSGFSSNNAGVSVTGTISTSSGNINATAGQVKSKTLSVTSTSYLSGTVTCGGNLTASSGTITGYNLKATRNMNCVDAAISSNLSVGNNAWIKYLYVNGTWVSSDKRKKMDIRYVDKDEQTIAESGLIAPNVNINKNDMHEFIEALPIASYRYIDDVENKKDVTHYGLVVQDVLYTKVGSELVKVLDDEKQIGDEDDYMGYSQEKLLTFMCGALQKEIELRKELEKRIEELENKSNK